MISRYEYPGGVWVDLEQPDVDEIRRVLREFNISERIGTELLSPTPLPLVAGDESTALLVLHFPTPRDADDGESKSQEIDMIVGPHMIITVRYELVLSIHHLKKLLETDLAISGNTAITTDVLLEILFAHLYSAVRDHVMHAADALAQVERAIFDPKGERTVRAISQIGRDFLHLESTLLNHEEPLARFLKTLSERKYFGPAFGERAARILSERTHVAHLVRTYRALTSELRETNLALLETHQNEIMKTLTVITVIVLPLELIAFIFGMHANGTPLEGHPQAFWIIMALMLTLVAGMALYFSRRKWL